MKTITRNVISYCDIPQEITDKHWISEISPDVYQGYTINLDNPNNLDKWFMENYPELIGHTFLIEIDY